MVNVFFIVIPIFISSIPVGCNLLFSNMDIRTITGIFHAFFTLLTLITAFTAIVANKDNPSTRKAWVYFFVGILMFTISGFTRKFTGGNPPYLSKIMFLISTIPILIFILLTINPLRHFLYTKKQKMQIALIYSIIGILFVIAIIIPILLRLPPKQKIEHKLFIIHSVSTLFQLAIIFPISGILILFGIKPGNLSYLLIGLGFMAGLITEIITLYRFFFNNILVTELLYSTGYLQITYLFMGGFVETLYSSKRKN